MRLQVAAVLCAASLATACGRRKEPIPDPSAEALLVSSGQQQAPPRQGMAWIPPGVLIAGTPADRVPRVADAELAGVAFEMTGFYVDLYPHPNEQGTIPTTNVTLLKAQGLCNAQGKRLCTELELERACKGPDNFVYDYGDDYRAEVCGTGRKGEASLPNGFHPGCESPFGVFDLHGTVWFWTLSEYGRGTTGLFAIKGGNSPHGELVGRCAHVRGQKPASPSIGIGFRCCAGPVNFARVELEVKTGPALTFKPEEYELAKRFDEVIVPLGNLVEGGVGDTPAGAVIAPSKTFHVERIWTWHPLGNEELQLAGGCTAPTVMGPASKSCGLFIGRDHGDRIQLLVFIATDEWQPTLAEGDEPRLVQVMGGDHFGAFRKTMGWEWGRVSIGGKQRRRGKHLWVTP